MPHLSSYRSSIHAGFGTSVEVLAAIEAVAGDDILDAGSNAARIWADPTAAEMDAVLTAAWQLADAEEDVLVWGGSHYRV